MSLMMALAGSIIVFVTIRVVGCCWFVAHLDIHTGQCGFLSQKYNPPRPRWPFDDSEDIVLLDDRASLTPCRWKGFGRDTSHLMHFQPTLNTPCSRE